MVSKWEAEIDAIIGEVETWRANDGGLTMAAQDMLHVAHSALIVLRDLPRLPIEWVRKEVEARREMADEARLSMEAEIHAIVWEAASAELRRRRSSFTNSPRISARKDGA